MLTATISLVSHAIEFDLAPSCHRNHPTLLFIVHRCCPPLFVAAALPYSPPLLAINGLCCCLESYIPPLTRCAHFAIYDGHGGRLAAEYAQKHLHNNVLSTGLPLGC